MTLSGSWRYTNQRIEPNAVSKMYIISRLQLKLFPSSLTINYLGSGCQASEKHCNSYSTTLTNGHSGNHSNTSSKENGHGGPATPCTPGDPLTHYHHRNEDHYTASFACMNRMRIHSQVSKPIRLYKKHKTIWRPLGNSIWKLNLILE